MLHHISTNHSHVIGHKKKHYLTNFITNNLIINITLHLSWKKWILCFDILCIASWWEKNRWCPRFAQFRHNLISTNSVPHSGRSHVTLTAENCAKVHEIVLYYFRIFTNGKSLGVIDAAFFCTKRQMCQTFKGHSGTDQTQ